MALTSAAKGPADFHDSVRSKATLPTDQYVAINIVHKNKNGEITRTQLAEYYHSHGKHKMLLQDQTEPNLRCWAVLSNSSDTYYFTRGARSEFFRMARYWPFAMSTDASSSIPVWNEIGAGGANCLLFGCKDWFTWNILVPALNDIDGYSTRVRDQHTGFAVDVEVPEGQLPSAYRMNEFTFSLNDKYQVTGVRFGIDPENKSFVTDIAYDYEETGQYRGFVFSFLKNDVSYGTIEGSIRELSTAPIPQDEFLLAKYGLQEQSSVPVGWIVVAAVAVLGASAIGLRRRLRL